ncbi:MAG: SUMF1/EgtB/PvdO family nonheme iron enzyme [Muribaculaceae bacterium]
MLLGLLLFDALIVSAQGISVASFRRLDNDLTANIAGTMMKDQNGDVAALIKVVTTQTGFTFEGGMAGIVKTRQEAGEIWVYVPHGIQRITIKHPQLGVLRDYYFEIGIEAARTYEMVLTTGEVRTVVTQDTGGSFLAITVTPKTASVYIDEELQENDGSGEITKLLPYGEHQYRVEAGNYLPEAGVVTIGKEKQTLTISLKSALASLSVNSTTPGTRIFVNEKLRGTDKWQGSLAAGMYVIEGKLDGYHDSKTTINIGKQEAKTVTLPALVPMYGTLSVNYKPIGAEVWLDGKQLGSSPDIFKNVLAGKHKLTIKKSGYSDHSEDVLLAEGENKSLSGTLQQGSVATTPIASGSGSSGNNQTFTVKGVLFTMIAVEGGTFTMGATPEQGSDAYSDEKPTHQVTLSSYYIGETEVTQALWQAVMGNNPSYFKGDNLPVERVSWDDCQEFIKKLNALTGRKFRLPTEAEWEYAARGGKKSRGYKYSGSNNVDNVAWYKNNSDEKTHPVKTKQPNELGIYDMSGNVYESCHDWDGKYSSNAQSNPKGPNIGSDRMGRGGSWLDYAGRCRSSSRDSNYPGHRNGSLGFRLVLSK